MKFIDVPKPGGPEALLLADAPMPAPKAGEVLIKVAAAGLNRADVLQRRGDYPSPPGAPPWPGLEVGGTVEALGEGVSEFHKGDAVCALLQGGGYAQWVAAPVGQVLALPLQLSNAAPPTGGVHNVSNVFIDTAGFAFAISKEFVTLPLADSEGGLGMHGCLLGDG